MISEHEFEQMKSDVILYEFKNGCSDLVLTPDGKYAAVISSCVQLYQMPDMQLVFEFKKPQYPSSIAFSNNSKLLAIRNTFGEIAVINIERLKIVKRFNDNNKEGADILFSPDDRFIVTSDWTGNIFTIDVIEDEVVVLRHYPEHMVHSVKYNPLTMKFLFVIVSVQTDNHIQTMTEKSNLIVEIKYPFNEKHIVERKISESVIDVLYNHSKKKYFFTNYHSVDVYNESFGKSETVKTFNEPNYNYSTDCTPDGKYFVVECHSQFSLYKYNDQMELIESFDVGLCKIKFIVYRGIMSLFIGTVENGYIIDFNQLANFNT